MSFWRRLVDKFAPTEGEAVDWEALLIEADLGLTLATRWMDELAAAKKDRDPVAAEFWLRNTLSTLVQTAPPLRASATPEVILLVGVNGSGKTTSAAKLAWRARQEGRTVMLAAGDTFRAAAVDQLQVWGERLGAPVITGPDGSDPATVAFRGVEAAVAAGVDLLIVDTAGRMPNKNNLMQEIAKVKRVMERQRPGAPHHVWLVVDGTTGANVLAQAREFHAAAGVTGMIMTKLDGTARGGMVAAVRAELGIPTFYLGRGEKPEDLEPFNAERYVEAFFSR